MFEHEIESRVLMSQVKNHQSSRSRQENICISVIYNYTGFCKAMARSSTQRILDRREQLKIPICGQGMQKKRRIENLSLGYLKVMGFKLIKRDEALQEMNGEMDHGDHHALGPTWLD